ncbi:hypothetical protein BH10PLA1_BH10PLA1_15420 [soil metagenome]
MPSPAYDTFRKSMKLDFDAWKEGTGYDMDAFDGMTADEKTAVVKEILARGTEEPLDWRDMEILSHENSREAFDRLRDELVGRSCDQQSKALRYTFQAERRMGEAVFDNMLARILDAVTSDDGVTQSLICVDMYCGPRTKAALDRGMRERPDVAIHFACKLLNLAEVADDWVDFDPRYRPTLVKLLPGSRPAERAEALAKVDQWLAKAGKR